MKHFWLFLLCPMLLTGQTANPLLAEPSTEFQILFPIAPQDGAACYRIPSLVTAVNGDLLAAIDQRVPNCADLRGNENINIVLRRSSDGGKTWSDLEEVVNFPLGQSASDPSMIVDQETGQILLFYNYMDLENARDQYFFHLVTSDDHGRTWSEPRDITISLAPSSWAEDFKFITSGRGIQTRSGRLLHTIVNLDKGLFLFASDDHGKSWYRLKTPVKPADESKVVELSDGSLMINSRVNTGQGLRYVHTSTDGGKTWTSRPEPQLVDPGNNASLLRYSGKLSNGEDILLFSNTNHSQERKNLSIRASYDQGKTWSAGRTIFPGSAAYSSMTVLPDGDIGIFFEKDDYQKNVFVRVPIDHFTPLKK